MLVLPCGSSTIVNIIETMYKAITAIKRLLSGVPRCWCLEIGSFYLPNSAPTPAPGPGKIPPLATPENAS